MITLNLLNANDKMELIEKAQTFLNIAGNNGEQFTIGYGLNMQAVFVKDRESKKILFEVQNFSDDYFKILFVLNGIEYQIYRYNDSIQIKINVNGDWMDINKDKFDKDFDKFIELYK